MLVRFQPPPTTDSPLARLDARWRLVGLFALVVAASVPRSLPAAGFALLVTGLLSWLSCMPWRWLLQRLLILAGLLALFVLPLPLFAAGDRLEGLRLAGVVLLKGLSLFSLGAILLVTSPVDVSLKAAQALYVPGLFVQLTLLGYRYLYVLADELDRLRIALRVRGFRNRASLHAYHTVSAATGTLLVRGHDRGERVAQAMRCRGFDGQFRSLSAFTTRSRDVVACLAALLLAAGAIVWLDVVRMRT